MCFMKSEIHLGLVAKIDFVVHVPYVYAACIMEDESSYGEVTRNEFTRVQATVESLEAVRSDEEDIRNQIQASVALLTAKGVEVEAELLRLNRP